MLAAVILPGKLKAGTPGSDKAIVSIFWNGLRINAENAAILVPPSKEQVLSFWSGSGDVDVKPVECTSKGYCKCRGSAVIWTAPSTSGDYWINVKLNLMPDSSGDSKASSKKQTLSIKIAALVGFPGTMIKDGHFNGFELGEYPDWREMSNPDLYKPPAYFYFIDKPVLGRFISTHIQLGDLGYDGRAPLPQYSALDYELVKKLELLHGELERLGLPCRFNFIGGGFISPKSNGIRTSRNSAAANLSRHMWGEAVDFMIDEDPKDEVMDDMNGDGVIDVRDAFVVRDILTELEESGLCRAGGVGVYSPPRNHQVQLHVDVRGFPTRWGVKTWDAAEFAGVPPKKSLRPGG